MIVEIVLVCLPVAIFAAVVATWVILDSRSAARLEDAEEAYRKELEGEARRDLVNQKDVGDDEA